MYHPRLRGSYHEMGVKHATNLIKNEYQLPDLDQSKLEFGKESYKELQHFFPEVIDEIKGLAETLGVSEEHIATLLLSPGAPEKESQGTSFAYKNEDQVLFARSFDFHYNETKFTEASLVKPDGKFAYLAHSKTFIGREDGFNEKGLAITATHVDGKSHKPGVNYYFIVRYILENCSSTDEAIHIIEQAPLSVSSNYLISDKKRSMVVVEAAPEKTMVRKPERNFISCTNHFQSPEMKAFEQSENEWSKSTIRLQETKELLAEKEEDLTIDDIREVLADKSKSLLLDLPEIGFGTCWATITELTSSKILRAEGQPTAKRFKPEIRLDWLLSKEANKRTPKRKKAVQD
ncbi:C45 family peptidase [Cytophagaceae bacterium ABcell3]|nr:C45 family peptidase [Cytophagaceae bacterium ABcell3]